MRTVRSRERQTLPRPHSRATERGNNVNHHNLDWYTAQVAKLDYAIKEQFGIELSEREFNEVRDEVYRQVNSAKVRQQQQERAALERAAR